MKVFKTYFKIINKSKAQLIIYTAVFIGISVAFANFSKSNSNEFIRSDINVAIFDDKSDEDSTTNSTTDSTVDSSVDSVVGSTVKKSAFTDGFYEYIGRNAVIIELDDDEAAIQDALMFHQVEYIIRLPGDMFSKLRDMFNTNRDISYSPEDMGNVNNDASYVLGDMGSVNIKKMVLPDSVSEVYIDSLINKYMNTAYAYLDANKDMSEGELVRNILNDLSNGGNVEFYSTEGIDNPAAKSFFNFSLYTIFMLVIIGVCGSLFIFSKDEVKKRNLASPVKLLSYQMQLFMASIFYVLFVFLFIMVIGAIFFSDVVFTKAGLLIASNAFFVAITALSISFLVSNIAKSINAIGAIANIVGLGSSFICGAFVPQEMLGKGILFVSSFTPGYWYVKATNDIFSLTGYGFDNIRPILSGMGIQALFAVAILAVSMLLVKQKRVA